MKTLVRGTTLFLATVLSIGVFTACDSSDQENKKEEKIPTIEEIFKTFNESQNGKMSMALEVDAGEDETAIDMKINMDVESDGNVAYTVASTSMNLMGESFDYTIEMYTKVDGNSITTYIKDVESGEWISSTETVSEEDLESLAAGYEKLFKSEYFEAFDKETGRYVMKEGTKVTVNAADIMEDFGEGSADFYDAYIEYEDGSCKVFTKFSVEDTEGTLTLKYSNIGKVTVTLPEVSTEG